MYKPPSLRPHTDLPGYVVDQYGKLREPPAPPSLLSRVKAIPFKRITELALAVAFGWAVIYIYQEYTIFRYRHNNIPGVFVPPGIMSAILCVYFAIGFVTNFVACMFCVLFALDAWYLYVNGFTPLFVLTRSISFYLALIAYFMYGKPKYRPSAPTSGDIGHFRETQPYGSAGLATAAQIDRALRGGDGTGGNASAGIDGGVNAPPPKFMD